MEAGKLKELRATTGLSVAEASKQVHVTPRTWARYEAGDRNIPEGVVELFCIKNNIEYPRRMYIYHSDEEIPVK